MPRMTVRVLLEPAGSGAVEWVPTGVHRTLRGVQDFVDEHTDLDIDWESGEKHGSGGPIPHWHGTDPKGRLLFKVVSFTLRR